MNDIKIPYSIVKHLAELLSDPESGEMQDLYVYLQGKVIQSNLRGKYNAQDKELIQKYNNNKKLLDDLEMKLKAISDN